MGAHVSEFCFVPKTPLCGNTHRSVRMGGFSSQNPVLRKLFCTNRVFLVEEKLKLYHYDSVEQGPPKVRPVNTE
jgi:hypothetical protein